MEEETLSKTDHSADFLLGSVGLFFIPPLLFCSSYPASYLLISVSPGDNRNLPFSYLRPFFLSSFFRATSAVSGELRGSERTPAGYLELLKGKKVSLQLAVAVLTAYRLFRAVVIHNTLCARGTSRLPYLPPSTDHS